MLYFVLISLFSYFLGSISSAVIVSRKLYNTDIRNHGSNNAGATNTLRTFGKKAGIIVFFCDFSKGLMAVAVARVLIAFFNAPYEIIYFAGFFAQFGHIFPLFFGFKGGKGVATAAGAALGVFPISALILFGIFIALVLVTKFVSLASGICAVLYPIFAYFSGGIRSEMNFVFAASCAVLMIIKHASNIARILDGKENKISSE